MKETGQETNAFCMIEFILSSNDIKTEKIYISVEIEMRPVVSWGWDGGH